MIIICRETNLKIRQGIPETSHILTPEQARRLEGVIKSEHPNNSLYTYDASIELAGKEFPLDPQQLLLRVKRLPIFYFIDFILFPFY